MSGNRVYAVVDTNVIVSAMLSKNLDSNTIKILSSIISGNLIPIYNQEIIDEYEEVLSRDKFPFREEDIALIIKLITTTGIYVDAVTTIEYIPDPKDVVFYEVALGYDDAYLVTGNMKHFPASENVVSPAKMMEIIQG